MLEMGSLKMSARKVGLLDLDAPDSRGSNWQPTALLLIALVGAVLFRVYLLMANDFPVNDGALFLEFIRATAATFPWLPEHAAYNGLVLPFAYPPLSFWIGALLTKLGFDSLAVVRVLPILLNIGYLLLFAALLLKSGRSRLFTALAILFLSVNLRSFEWLLMGGGLTRGLGSVFLMLTLLTIGIADRGDRPRIGLLRLVLAGVAVAGAIVSHLEWGILAAGSFALSRALGSRNFRDFIASCAIAAATIRPSPAMAAVRRRRARPRTLPRRQQLGRVELRPDFPPQRHRFHGGREQSSRRSRRYCPPDKATAVLGRVHPAGDLRS